MYNNKIPMIRQNIPITICSTVLTRRGLLDRYPNVVCKSDLVVNIVSFNRPPVPVDG